MNLSGYSISLVPTSVSGFYLSINDYHLCSYNNYRMMGLTGLVYLNLLKGDTDLISSISQTSVILKGMIMSQHLKDCC